MTARVKVIVDNRLRLERSEIGPEVERALVDAFTYRNPQHAKKRAMGFSTWGSQATICTARLTARQLTLPRGGAQRVRDALGSFGLAPAWEDRRLALEPVDMPEHRVVLRSYQEDAVQKMVARENCLMRAPTGAGKTTAALALIARVRQPALVILWSANLLEQWRTRLQVEFGMRDRDIGMIRGGRRRLGIVTLAMQQSLWAKGIPEEVSGNFGLVLIDECQKVAAKTVRVVLDAFPARYRFGISASEKRKDGMEFLTYDLFGPVAADVKRADLVDAGTIHDVTIRVSPTSFEADWYGGVGGDSREAFDFNRLLDEMTRDADREARLLGTIQCELAGGHRVLVFTHRVEHAQRLSDAVTLATGHPCGLMIGGPENAVAFEETRRAILGGTMSCAVGTVQAIGQGIDLPAVDRGIVATPVASNRQLFDQVRGRICRRAAGKDSAELVYLLDWRVYPGHLKNIEAWCDDVSCDGDDLGDLRERCSRLARSRQSARWGRREDGVPGFED